MATQTHAEAKLSRTRSVEALRIRERTDDLETQSLAEYATRSATGHRDRPEEPSPTRAAFAVDRDRIVHSKAFRRLKHKTQVFLAPVGDHYRTRLTHTLEVTQIGRSMARALRLNEDLVEAMALGHDVGHTPFGHVGEELLGEFLPEGFRHNAQSVRIVEKIEKNGAGLNITREVRKAQGVLLALLRHFEQHPEVLPPEHQRIASADGTKRAVADYVAGMTDRYALDTYASIFIPTVWSHL